MKHKTLLLILVIEAALCVALRILQASFGGMFAAAMAFPYEQIGMLLRSLSLSGWLGNIAAFAFYAVFSLVPAVVLLVLAKRQGFHREDLLLGLLSVSLFAVMYLMINPGIIGSLFGGAAGLSVGKAILGGTVYSVLCGYIVLRALRLFFAGSTEKLEKYMSALLGILSLVFVWLAFGEGFGRLVDSMAALHAGNTGGSRPLGPSEFFLVLQFLVDALPYVLDVAVVFAALRLLDEMRADRYSPECAAAAGRLSRLCGTALAVTVLVSIAFNLAQLMFAKTLAVINSTVQIPVLTIAFVLAVLLLSRFIAENKRLKDDNDMFI